MSYDLGSIISACPKGVTVAAHCKTEGAQVRPEHSRSKSVGHKRHAQKSRRLVTVGESNTVAPPGNSRVEEFSIQEPPQ